MYDTQKGIKELILVFSQLKPTNKNYALSILHSLYYAQEISSQKDILSDKEENKPVLVSEVAPKQ